MRVKNIGIILGLCLFTSFSLAADWPHWRGPDRNGISTETDWNPIGLNDLKIAWEAEIGTGFSAVSVADGKAYTVGNLNKDTDVVYCFDALTGKELWTFTYPEPLTPNMYEGGCNATPAIENGKVYTISKTAKVFCLDANTGKQVWKSKLPYKKPQWGFSGSPVIVDDLVILNVGTAGAALNKADGEIVWKSADGAAGYASAVPFEKDGTTYVAMFCAKTLEVIEVKTGKIVMTYTWETSYDVNAADPIVFGDEIFITAGYGHGAALVKMTPDGLQEIWQNKNMRSQMSGPVLIDGFVYGIDDNQLACVDWKTGKQRWSEKAPKKGSLCAAKDKLIVIGEKGKLFIVQASPDGYQEIASAQVLSDRCWTMPVLANGRIYVRNAVKNKPSKLICVDVQDKNAPMVNPAPAVVPAEKADWPQWKGPRRDNISAEAGLAKQWPAEGPLSLWKADGLGQGYSTVSIADGKIYTAGMIEKEGFLFCLDLDGKLLWKQSYGEEWSASFPGARSTPTVQNDQVYIISGFGKVACFNAQTGQMIWQADPVTDFEGKYGRWGDGQSPLVVGDKVISVVGGSNVMVIALSTKDGSVVWKTPGNGDKSAYSSPAVYEWAGKTVIVGMTDNNLFGINVEDGSILWMYPAKNYMSGKNKGIQPNTPYFKDGLFFFTSGYDMGSVQLRLSPDGTSVEKVWSNPEFDTHHGSFVAVDGYIYGTNWEGNKNGNWMCVDWKTGTTQYNQSWENKGSLTFADGMLYCYEEGNGNVALVKLDPKGFEVVSSFQITEGGNEHWAHPVVFGKRLYMRHGDVLMAFDIEG